MYRAYAADPQTRINLGIRRRLAPLLGNDRRKIELMNGLLFSLPGTPVIYYGDEIGMGDNVYLGDRNGVRTPMQWSGRPQRRLLARQPAAALPAADHRPRVPLRDGQRRGPAAQPALAAVVDAAADRPAQAPPGLRPRDDRVPRARQPQGARVPPPARGRADPRRGQPLALRAVRRARPARSTRAASRSSCSAGRLPADRRRAVPHHASARTLLWLQLRRRPRGGPPAVGGPRGPADPRASGDRCAELTGDAPVAASSSAPCARWLPDATLVPRARTRTHPSDWRSSTRCPSRRTGRDVALAIVEVSYTEGEPERYLPVLALADGGLVRGRAGTVADLTPRRRSRAGTWSTPPRIRRSVGGSSRSSAARGTGEGPGRASSRVAPTKPFASMAPKTATPHVRLIRGEQSNSSLDPRRHGDPEAVSGARERREPGPRDRAAAPDRDCGFPTCAAARRRDRATAAKDGTDIVARSLQPFVANEGDVWALSSSRARRVPRRGRRSRAPRRRRSTRRVRELLARRAGGSEPPAIAAERIDRAVPRPRPSSWAGAPPSCTCALAAAPTDPASRPSRSRRSTSGRCTSRCRACEGRRPDASRPSCRSCRRSSRLDAEHALELLPRVEASAAAAPSPEAGRPAHPRPRRLPPGPGALDRRRLRHHRLRGRAPPAARRAAAQASGAHRRGRDDPLVPLRRARRARRTRRLIDRPARAAGRTPGTRPWPRRFLREYRAATAGTALTPEAGEASWPCSTPCSCRRRSTSCATS